MSEAAPSSRQRPLGDLAALLLGLGGVSLLAGASLYVHAQVSPPVRAEVGPSPAMRLALMERLPTEYRPLAPGQVADPEPKAPEQPRFIVRFKNQRDLQAGIGKYFSDEDAARSAFERWRADHPAFAEFELAGATYSGEAVLVFTGDMAGERPVVIRQIARRLSALETVAYADPDFSAQIGESE